ncbi:hypothetical protein [Paenibacillus kandeliae]
MKMAANRSTAMALSLIIKKESTSEIEGFSDYIEHSAGFAK